MSKLKVGEKNNYRLLTCSEKCLKGEVLLRLEGKIIPSPEKYSVQLSGTEHILPDEKTAGQESSFYKYINHSCSPNSFFDIQKRELITLRDIEAGEEITYNYNTTEYDMQCPFTCECGSDNCLKEIKGFKYLTAQQKKELISYLSPYLKKLYLRSCVVQ